MNCEAEVVLTNGGLTATVNENPKLL